MAGPDWSYCVNIYIYNVQKKYFFTFTETACKLRKSMEPFTKIV